MKTYTIFFFISIVLSLSFPYSISAQESLLLSIPSLDENLEYMNRVEISPDGTKILTGGYTPALWDAETGELLKTFPITYERIIARSLTFSKDGKMVLIGEDPFSAKLWDVETGEHLHTFQSYTFNNPDISNPTLGGISAADFSKDGHLLLTGDINGAVQLWDMNTFEEIRRFKQLMVAAKISFLPNENKFLVVEDRTLIFDLESGQIDKTIHVSVPSFSSNKQNLFGYSSTSEKFQLWNLTNVTLINEFELDLSFGLPFLSYTISPNANWIMVLNSDEDQSESKREVFQLNTLERVLSVPTSESADKNSPNSRAISVKFFPEGDRFLTVNGNTVHIWSTENFSSNIKNPSDF